MNDLNQLLKNKAEGNLKKEISEYLHSIKEHKFFKAICDRKVIISEGAEGKTALLNSFFWQDSTAARLIQEHFTEEYVFQEAKSFMEKVEELGSDIEELKNQQEH